MDIGIGLGMQALSSVGGGVMSALGGQAANAQNAQINRDNIAFQQQANTDQMTFQNNVNVANWAYQDKVNEENRQFAREQTNFGYDVAKQQEAFQERMSSSAYQRAMQDMKLAGLNPILAYQQGGASTPAGSSVNPLMSAGQGTSGQGSSLTAPQAKLGMQNTQEELGRAVGRMVSSGYDLAKTDQTVKNLKSSETLIDQQGQHEGQRMEKTIQETYSEKERNKLLVEQQNETRARAEAARAASAASYAQAGLSSETARQYRGSGMPGYGLGERIIRNLPDPGPQKLPNSGIW